jgi:hypothetical protein
MSTVEEKLIRWVRSQMVDLTEEGLAQRLELFHVVKGQGADRLHTLNLKEGDSYEEHAQELWDLAEHDASTRVSNRPEEYVVASFKDSEDPCSQYRILMRRFGSHTTDMMGADTEGPTETGIVAQQLRHTETLHRVLAGSVETLLARQQNECERLSRRNGELEQAHLKLIEIYAEAADKKAEREIAQAEALSRARRHEQLMGLVMTIGPAVVAQILGAKNPAGASAARDATMQEFFERLTPEEMTGALTALKPTNRLALVELFKSFGAAHEAEQQLKPEVFRDGISQKDQEEDNEEEQQAPRH